MISTPKDYGVGWSRHWSREDFEFEGLCSHSSLVEADRG
jgi:hypothetical protein